jgi:hypothetical protein
VWEHLFWLDRWSLAGEDEMNWALPFLPFFNAISLAVGMLLLDPVHLSRGMLVGVNGSSSIHCLLYIMLFAAVPLTPLIWALRKGAPTQLNRSGALAGIVAGAIAAELMRSVARPIRFLSSASGMVRQ